MRNKEQHGGKGKGWAYNNCNMCNTKIEKCKESYVACLCLHVAPYFSCHHHALLLPAYKMLVTVPLMRSAYRVAHDYIASSQVYYRRQLEFALVCKMLKIVIVLSVLLGILSGLLGIAHCQGQDLTTQPGTSGSVVVFACISRIQQSGIFTSDNEMLSRIAYVETNDGNDADTYRSGYHGGIWAVDEDLFDETQNTASYSTLTNLHQEIQSTFSIQWSSVQWNDLRKPLYSAL